MAKRSMLVVVCVGCFLMCLIVGNAFGTGFDNSGVGLRGISLGGAFVGIANDSSAVYYNPAGLSFAGSNKIDAEVYGWLTMTRFRYKTDVTQDTSDEIFLIPGFFMSKTYDKWAFGFGSYIPYAGGGAVYKNFQNTPYDYDVYSAYNAYTWSAAYKVNAAFSVGFGVSAYNGILEGEYFDPGHMTFVETEYDGIAGYGYNFGVIYKPTDTINAGLSVISSVPIEMDGEQKIDGVKYDSELRFRLPYYLSLGIGYTPDDKLTIGFSFCYMQYGSLDEVSFTTDSIINDVATYYTNEWRVGAGAEYKYNDKMDIRAGLKFIPSGTERKGMDPTANDINILAPSIGIGYAYTDTIELDLTLQYVCGFEKEYRGQKYDMDNKVLLMGIRYNK